MSRAAIEQARELTKNLAREYLESIAASVQEHGTPVQAVTIERGPHEEILRFVETNQAESDRDVYL